MAVIAKKTYTLINEKVKVNFFNANAYSCKFTPNPKAIATTTKTMNIRLITYFECLDTCKITEAIAIKTPISVIIFL